MLRQLTDTVARVALGASILLTWALLLTLAGVALPTLDGSVVVKAVALKVDWPLLTLWAAAAVVSMVRKSRPAAFAVTGLLAFSACFGERIFAAATVAATIAATALSVRYAAASLLLGVTVFELLRVAYLLLSIYGVILPGSEALEGVHYSLYAPLTWVLPLLALAACLAPVARLLFQDAVKPGRGSNGLPPARLALPLSLALAVLLWLLMYKSPLNTGRLVGVDAPVYHGFAERMLAEGYLSVTMNAFCDRPLFMLLLMSLAAAVGSRAAVEAMPLICLTANALAAYALGSAIEGKKLGGLAALLSTMTYTTTAGIFAGYYANWLTLAVSQLAAAALTLWLKERKLKHLILAASLASVAVTMHVHMGLVITTALAAACTLAAIMRPNRATAFAAALVLATPLAIAALVNQLQKTWGGSCAMLEVSVSLAGQWGVDREAVEAGLPLSEKWWNALHFALYNWMFTAALDPTDWLLLTAAALTAPLPQALTLLAWLLTSGLMVVTAPDSLLIHRALYSLPIATAAAVSLEGIQKRELVWAITAFKLSYTLSFIMGMLA
ncbi:MAG: hypothetical protein QXT93_10365 [Thermofilum sp.]